MLAQPIYINRIASIHPPIEKHAEWIPGKQFVAVEPDYKEWIPNASVRRRMSRIVRMGVAAGLQCLSDAPDITPDAILTATGLGCLADTEKFMNHLLDMNEELLPPTAFIQSTFNTIGAQIALLSGNHGYNNTYVHRAFSLESALLDASLLIKEGEAKHVLVGTVDELTPALSAILKRFGCHKHTPIGEGAAFFLVSGEPEERTYAVIKDIKLFSGNYNQEEIKGASNSKVLEPTAYKRFCGEYPTAMSFALWYACTHQELGYTMLHNSFLSNHSFIRIERV